MPVRIMKFPKRKSSQNQVYWQRKTLDVLENVYTRPSVSAHNSYKTVPVCSGDPISDRTIQITVWNSVYRLPLFAIYCSVRPASLHELNTTLPLLPCTLFIDIVDVACTLLSLPKYFCFHSLFYCINEKYFLWKHRLLITVH